jgi:hypothetical protein
MQEYIYKENNKYFREITDMLGVSLLLEEIPEQEYLNYKERDLSH